MQKERFKVVPAVYLILVKKGKILLLKRFNTGYEDGNYSMIAGHVDEGEAPKAALAREAYEEAGISVKVSDLEYALAMYRHFNRVDLFFAAKNWQGEVRNMEPAKCDDLSWFDLDDLPQNMIPCVRRAIDCYKLGVHYYEFGWS